MKLSSPPVYRRLFAAGLLVVFAGIYFTNFYIELLGLAGLILSKYGMRKEHKEKKERGEIK